MQTNELSLAATLVCLGYPMVNMIKDDAGRCTFVFSDDPGIEVMKEKFWAGKLKVDALTYFNAIKTVKSRIYA